jgi:hypothetical protein
MIDPKELLQHFSNSPIDIHDLKALGFDLDDKAFLDCFAYLERKEYICPLHAKSCGINRTSSGASYGRVDIIITERGSHYLNPPKAESDKLKNWLIRPIIVAVATAVITAPISGVIGFYIGKKLAQEPVAQHETQEQDLTE